MIDNPYWEAVAEHAKRSTTPWEDDHLVVARMFGSYDSDGNYRPVDIDALPDRQEHVGRYAWTITDPVSVQFVARHAAEGLVDPMAGTGYWAYLLKQLGVDVVCYDANPCHEDNGWHRENPLWVPVAQGWAEVVIDEHPDRTLLLSWPPYDVAAGYRTLREYRGRKVIYLGEREGGCTGDAELFELLERDWARIDHHEPVQWFSVHDVIEVYQRRDLQ